jgi:Asp-tRNA(Asn)/Glu-tRNA(Gln) amidotransferase A subunit family amidase
VSNVAPMSLVGTVSQLRGGGLDPHALVDACCDRAERLDPVLHALVPEPGRRRRLHADAGALLGAFPEPASRPPLFGALVGVKDVLRVGGLPTAGGSDLPPEELDGAESPAVAALRAAGALVMGKTVTAELAYAAPGPTRNPHDPARTPGGSSHGSAAGVAAGLFPLALGTQTIASIMRPAAYCGVAGYVPTFGRIPAGGLLVVSRTLDRVGLFAADVPSLSRPRPRWCAAGAWRAGRAVRRSGWRRGRSSTTPSRPRGSCSSARWRRWPPPATRCGACACSRTPRRSRRRCAAW